MATLNEKADVLIGARPNVGFEQCLTRFFDAGVIGFMHEAENMIAKRGGHYRSVTVCSRIVVAVQKKLWESGHMPRDNVK